MIIELSDFFNNPSLLEIGSVKIQYYAVTWLLSAYLIYLFLKSNKIIKEINDSAIQNVTTFDIYEGENIPKDKKSVAISVTIQASDKTLSEKDLDHISKRIIEVVKEKTGATIRS